MDLAGRSGSLLVGVLLLGALIRVVLILGHSEQEFLRNDGEEYKDISENLASGNGYSISFYRWYEPVDPSAGPIRPEFYRAPLLPLIGAALIKLPGGWQVWSRAASVALGTLAVFMVYWVAACVFNRVTGLIAGSMFALYPHAIFYSTYWLTELLATPLLLACVGSCAIWRRDNHRVLLAVAVGALAGLATMARPNLIVCAAGIIGWMLLVAPGWRVRVRGVGACLSALILVLLPWTFRNYTTLGTITPLTHFGPYAMWMGTNEYIYDQYTNPVFPRTERGLKGERLREGSDRRIRWLEEQGITSVLEANEFWREETWDFVSTRTDEALYVFWSKFVHFWSPFPTRSRISPLGYWVGLTATSTLIVLSAATLLLFRPRNALLLLVPALVSSIAFLPFYFALRYRFPVVDPYLTILGAYSVYRTLRLLLSSDLQAKACDAPG
jgi:4-amino-4-deoxy-L-arabinose transferase-like glycosyltransferase